MPPLDLALGLGMVWSPTNMIHAVVIEPFGQFSCDVTGPIVRCLTSAPLGHIEVFS